MVTTPRKQGWRFPTLVPRTEFWYNLADESETGRFAMRYLVIVERTETGFSAFSPDLPGCVATGATREEAEQNMKEAIRFHLEGMQQEGVEIPKPHSCSTYLEVPA